MSYVTSQLFFLFLLLPTNTNPSTPFGSNRDCSGALFSFSDCLEFAEDGANAAGPNRGCCSGLGRVLGRGVACLCEAMREAARLGVPINVTRALALPSLCGLSFAPTAPCSKTPPKQSPASPSPGSPGPSPIEPPSTQPTPSPSQSTPPPSTSPSQAPSLAPLTAPSPPPAASESPRAPEAPTAAPAASASKSGATEIAFSVMASVVALVAASFSYSEL